ncbi:macrolide ABC transporter ATP-binding protein [Streptomyces abyssalis]|uniref:Macrolide ABC transporter ATP-binding protein n=1 Tax=Streptomyces abyssalis TaxID=933944 RepID=A0A1E7JJM4_9ACTN|nr:ABC transporter ATP-binding protein [Streptomyces abyssalis]OEU87316.1 macrolide ABC transporter ATP-binding protein [Streptomyces abyssalis]OEU87847.1 macrolide ABC transporter ATP-binding protein [Streptomyces abyssalis]OEV28426.1 macrolide ABC transporter ATP-binding protein [Streptomyces nanshensis]
MAHTSTQDAGTGVTLRGGAKLRGVSKSYGDGEASVAALDGVDLDLGAGELVVVLGPSGSGKTTLLNVLGGIEPAGGGSVEVAGVDLTGRRPRGLAGFRRDHIGFVFQFFNLVPTLTARENVEVMVELTGRGERRDAAGLLESVGLGDRLDHFPAQLSGGQQQRVAIARALATDPDLLLADEPTGALDVATGKSVLRLLQRTNREGRGVLMVTHNAAIARMAHRVVTMRDGRVESVERNAAPADVADVDW